MNDSPNVDVIEFLIQKHARRVGDGLSALQRWIAFLNHKDATWTFGLVAQVAIPHVFRIPTSVMWSLLVGAYVAIPVTLLIHTRHECSGWAIARAWLEWLLWILSPQCSI